MQAGITERETPTAVIVGGGFGGIGMAIKLRQIGITDFVMLEKSGEVGGTWRDNTYPGAACDVPSPLYSFSFAQDFDWPRFYSGHEDIHRYLAHCVAKYGLMPHVRLNCEIQRASFDEDQGLWKIETARGETVWARTLITATGQLNRPAQPKIPGLESFRGKRFHSARWDHGHDLAGRRVGVIGTGASAIQFVPHVVEKAAHVVLFQRTAPYVLPKPDRPIPAFENWLYRRVPLLGKLVRATVYGIFESLGIGLFKFRPALAPLRGLWSLHLRWTIKDPELRRKLTPDYPFGCKRLLFENNYYPALTKPHVTLVTQNIQSIGEDHVLTSDGVKHEIDTLILGTGFAASDFLAPMEIRGRQGQELGAVWREGAQAYLGITVSGFPNLFMLYGPNTNLGHNSIIYMLESQIRYVTDAIAQLCAQPDISFDVKPDIQHRFNTRLQQALESTAWAEGCKSWYINPHGKITNNWSSFTFTYRRLTRRFDAASYQRLGARDTEPAGAVTAGEPIITRIARLAVRTCFKPVLHPRFPIAFQRAWVAAATRTLLVPFGIRFETSRLGDVPVQTIRLKSAPPDSATAVLFLHGGAFILGSPATHRSITGRIAKLTGATVFVADYRLAPEHPFPAALDDALACYRALLARGYAPDRIAVAGDSAGGGLAVSLCLRLRDEGLEQPVCLALISPWVDLRLSQLAPVFDDVLLSHAWLQQGASAYLRNHPAADPLVSPVLADLGGLPPTLVHAAAEEILRNDARRLRDALTAAGVAVTPREFPRLWHDFQLYAGQIPEATRSVEEMARFIIEQFARAVRQESESPFGVAAHGAVTKVTSSDVATVR